MTGPLTFAQWDRPLPTVPGCTAGVVYRAPDACTTQCAVCFTCATGKAIFATGWACFADDGEGKRPLPYRRCPACRTARRHPEVAS